MTEDQINQTADPTAVAAAEDQLQGEHARMNDLLERVGATDQIEVLAALLQQLHTQLRQHFAREEYPGGLYDVMGACKPEFRQELRVLVDDHFRMLASVRGLAARAKEGGDKVRSVVLGEVTELIDFIHRHEKREHEMAKTARRRAGGD